MSIRVSRRSGQVPVEICTQKIAEIIQDIVEMI